MASPANAASTGSSSLDSILNGLQNLLTEEAKFTVDFIEKTNPQQVTISSSHDAKTNG